MSANPETHSVIMAMLDEYLAELDPKMARMMRIVTSLSEADQKEFDRLMLESKILAGQRQALIDLLERL